MHLCYIAHIIYYVFSLVGSIGMFSAKQVVQYNLFGSNGLEGISSCEFAHFPEEVFEISSEENQVIGSLESKIENLQQENFDLKKNVGLQKHYKKRVEEYYEEVSELTREMQTLEGEIKKLEVKLQKSTRSLTENDQDIGQLKQKVEISLLETQNKSDIIKNLNNQLKEAKNEIQLTDKINEELQQKLDLTEAELNRVKKESTLLINIMEDLKGNYENQILEKKKELNDIRDQLYIYLSEYKELFAEFSSLQKKNKSLKQKNFYISNEVSLADEINKENVRKEIARPQSIPEVETRCIKNNDDQEPTWLCREGENNQYDKTSEDKNLENIYFEIGVWNEADNESSDDHKSTRLYGKTENCLTSEDKNLENTDFPIEVWNGTDSESEDEDEDEDNFSPCPNYDESFGRRYSQLLYDANIMRKEDSFSLAKIKLNAIEVKKYESIWQKIDKIHDDLNVLNNRGNDEDYEKCEKEFDKVISEALEQGIMFSFPYKSDISLVDRIADTLQKLYLSYDSTRIHEFLDKKKILQIISEGAFLNSFSDEEHEDVVNVICSDKDTLDQRKANLSKLNELALESIMNKSEQ